jgi:hypothetical protein
MAERCEVVCEVVGQRGGVVEWSGGVEWWSGVVARVEWPYPTAAAYWLRTVETDDNG